MLFFCLFTLFKGLKTLKFDFYLSDLQHIYENISSTAFSGKLRVDTERKRNL